MNVSVKIALVVAACSFLGAAASAQGVKLTPQLKTGDGFGIEVTAVREDSSRPGPTGKGITPVDVRVVSATPNGVVLDWILGETRIESSQAVDPIVLAAANVLRGLRLRITLDADGAYAGLANEKEVVSRVQAVADQAAAAVTKELPADQRATMQKLFAQFLAPAVLVEVATKLPVLQLSDEGRFVVDRKLGLPRELVVNRRTGGGMVQRLDRREIRLVRAPRR